MTTLLKEFDELTSSQQNMFFKKLKEKRNMEICTNYLKEDCNFVHLTELTHIVFDFFDSILS